MQSGVKERDKLNLETTRANGVIWVLEHEQLQVLQEVVSPLRCKPTRMVLELMATTCRAGLHQRSFGVSGCPRCEVMGQRAALNISHAGNSADKPFACALVQFVEILDLGVRVFLNDESIPSSADPDSYMRSAMKSSHVAALLFSKEYFHRTATNF